MNRAECDDCMDCLAVCPEMQVITPAPARAARRPKQRQSDANRVA
ncbi:hypothetical protein MWU51_02120 [Aliiroseovarius sp. F47248L]|nr:hypothetical protein [Aliiroseovarius sp. F47248L]